MTAMSEFMSIAGKIAEIRGELNRDHPHIRYHLSYCGGKLVSLTGLISDRQGCGNASHFMDHLVELIKRNNLILTLRAGKPPTMPGLETPDLVSFYSRHGMILLSDKIGYGVRMVCSSDTIEHAEVDFYIGLPKGTYSTAISKAVNGMEMV